MSTSVLGPRSLGASALISCAVPDVTVAVDALHAVARWRARAAHHRVHEVAVAVDAVRLQDVGVAIADADRLVEILKRERLAVPKAVVRLGQILADEIVREVAVDALGRLVVAGL